MRTLPSLFVVCALGLPASAQCELGGWGYSGSGNFTDISVSGDRLAALQEGGGGPIRVHLFERTPTGWAKQVTLTVPANDFLLANRLVLDGDRLLVGTPCDGPGTASWGSAWIYEASNGWSTPVKLQAPVPTQFHCYGTEVDLDGDTVVVGDPMGNNTFTNYGTGRAWVYERSGSAWVQAAILDPFDQGLAGPKGFGVDVAVSGDLAAMSGIEPVAGSAQSIVLLWERTAAGWTPQARIEAPAGSKFLGWGTAIDLDGERLAVTSARGVAFHRRVGAEWQLEKFVEAELEAKNTHFGRDVSLDGDQALVGESSAVGPDGTVAAGRVHRLRRHAGTWEYAPVLEYPGVPTSTKMGRAVSVDGPHLAVLGSAPSQPNYPSARLYALPLEDVHGTCAGSSTSTGAVAALEVEGCASLLADSLLLGLSGAPPGEVATFLASAAAAQTPFGNGTVCLAAPVWTLGGGAIGVDGRLALDLDLAQGPLAGLLAGDLVHVQAVFRDTGFGAGAGTSDALAFPLQP